MRRARTRIGEGEKSERLIEKLRLAGYEVVTFLPAKGYWKQKRADVHPWEAVCRREETPLTFRLYSWDTITDCAQRPLFFLDEGQPHFVQVIAGVPEGGPLRRVLSRHRDLLGTGHKEVLECGHTTYSVHRIVQRRRCMQCWCEQMDKLNQVLAEQVSLAGR